MVYGARLKVRDGRHVEKGQVLVEWDPCTVSILTEASRAPVPVAECARPPSGGYAETAVVESGDAVGRGKAIRL